MNTYLQISGLIYISLIAFEYFRKKKINTIENITFRTILCSVIFVTIMDLVSASVSIHTSYDLIAEYLLKIYIGTLVVCIFFFSFYVYCISSDKAVANVDFKNHPNKKVFQKALLSTILGIVVIYMLIIALPLTIHVDPGVSGYCYGPAVTLTYVAAGVGVVSWIIQLVRNRKKLKDKRYIPVYCFFVMALAAIGFQLAFPTASIVTPIVIFITAIIFFTMENPDATLINKLNEAKSIAEDANDAKTNFLSSMSHEIRTPLNAIVGFGQALAKEDISGTAKEEVQDILMASNTLLDIVNGILDVQKIEANKIELVNGEYNTKKMISEITSLINARIGSKPIDFKVLVDEKLPAVLYGDCIRVKQIAINLLTNAVKYTEEGRILFQIKADNANGISKLTISVQDTGIGMTEEAIDQLFTKFERFDMVKKSNFEGTGLGMAVTKGLIDLMDGEINVKSKYGEGSTFFVTINQKIIQQTIEEEKTDDTTKAFNASGQKVLVVDDNKINLKVAKRLLSEYKLDIELVGSGSECIDKILDGKVYDLIFMDIMMPKMNGMEALENLKNIVGFKMPVVALTADVISGMEEKYISKGFDDCLAKPIVEEELYYMLRKFLKETKEEPAQEEKDENPVTETKTIEQSKEVAQVIVESKVEEPTPVVETKEEKESNSNDIHNVELLKNNKINVDAGLELLKDMEMYDMTLEEFYNELQNKIKDLTEFKESGNMDDYAILAHALKTEARYVGCNELGDMAYEHELAGKEKNQDKVNEKFDELITEANRVYKIIKRYLGE